MDYADHLSRISFILLWLHIDAPQTKFLEIKRFVYRLVESSFHALEKCIALIRLIFCSVFQNLRLGSMKRSRK